MQLKVWGTRGSIPVAAANYMKYGGNTSCFSIELEDRMLVLDAGSGLCFLGDYVNLREVQKRIDIFISHFHIDHVLGLFDFKPFFNPGAEIHLYGEEKDGISFKEQIEQLIRPPIWPLEVQEFPAEIVFHELKVEHVYRLTESIKVTCMHGKHPSLSLLFKLNLDGLVLFYGLDCEMDEEIWEQLVAFVRGSQVLICDAQFTPETLAERKGWGHSSWREGINLRRETDADIVLLTHFDRTYDDGCLQRIEEEIARTDSYAVCSKEGMVIELDTWIRPGG